MAKKRMRDCESGWCSEPMRLDSKIEICATLVLMCYEIPKMLRLKDLGCRTRPLSVRKEDRNLREQALGGNQSKGKRRVERIERERMP